MQTSKRAITSKSPPVSRRSSPALSSFYCYLPRLVQSRIPVLSSIQDSTNPTTTQSGAGSMAARNAPTASPLRTCAALIERQRWRDDSWPPSPDSLDSCSCASLAAPPGALEFSCTPPNRVAGIDWCTAALGVMLCTRAYSQATQYENTADKAGIRCQHVHGLTYILRALPEDLTPWELEEIHAALPDGLRGDGKTLAPALPHPKPPSRNLLSRTISYAMVQISLVISIVLPLLMQLLGAGIEYERRHQLAKRAVTKGIQTLEVVGVRILDLKDKLERFSEGGLGRALVGAARWFVEGLIDGVREGTGQSLFLVAQAANPNLSP